MAQWGVQWGWLEAAERQRVNNFHSSLSSTNIAHYSAVSSPVVVGGRVVVVFCLSFFFPFLSVLGFLVALGSFGSLFFFLSFFFLPSSGALLTLPKKPGKKRKTRVGQRFSKTHSVDAWLESNEARSTHDQNMIFMHKLSPLLKPASTNQITNYLLYIIISFLQCQSVTQPGKNPDSQMHFSGHLRSISIWFWGCLKFWDTFMENTLLFPVVLH